MSQINIEKVVLEMQQTLLCLVKKVDSLEKVILENVKKPQLESICKVHYDDGFWSAEANELSQMFSAMRLDVRIEPVPETESTELLSENNVLAKTDVNVKPKNEEVDEEMPELPPGVYPLPPNQYDPATTQRSADEFPRGFSRVCNEYLRKKQLINRFRSKSIYDRFNTPFTCLVCNPGEENYEQEDFLSDYEVDSG